MSKIDELFPTNSLSFFDKSGPNMTSSPIKAYIVELGEIVHKPCWSLMVSLLKVGFWERC